MDVLYISAGSSIFTYPEVQFWTQHSRFHVVNRTRLLPPGIVLGREEFGIIEALMSIRAFAYAGVRYSTRTSYVFTMRQASGVLRRENMPVPDFYWNLRCPKMLMTPPPEMVDEIRNRETKERIFLANHSQLVH